MSLSVQTTIFGAARMTGPVHREHVSVSGKVGNTRGMYQQTYHTALSDAGYPRRSSWFVSIFSAREISIQQVEDQERDRDATTVVADG
jgi:hypothetical protein